MRSLVPLVLFTSIFAAPAGADPEIETITCHGRIDAGAMTTPGQSRHGGHLSCSLGHGGQSGYSTYETFSANVDALVDNQTPPASAPGVYFTVAQLTFQGPDHLYTLQFNDWNIRGNLVMVDHENDYILFGDDDFVYHVRVGRITTCGPCPPTLLDGNIDFVAEYVYDLPVG